MKASIEFRISSVPRSCVAPAMNAHIQWVI